MCFLGVNGLNQTKSLSKSHTQHIIQSRTLGDQLHLPFQPYQKSKRIRSPGIGPPEDCHSDRLHPEGLAGCRGPLWHRTGGVLDGFSMVFLCQGSGMLQGDGWVEKHTSMIFHVTSKWGPLKTEDRKGLPKSSKTGHLLLGNQMVLLALKCFKNHVWRGKRPY